MIRVRGRQTADFFFAAGIKKEAVVIASSFLTLNNYRYGFAESILVRYCEFFSAFGAAGFQDLAAISR